MKEVENDFNHALICHRNALNLRIEYRNTYAVRESEEKYTAANRAVIQSQNNIASTLYQLCRYDEAIALHKKVGNEWLGIGDKYKAATSHKYILGCYIKKWKENGNVVERAECHAARSGRCEKQIDIGVFTYPIVSYRN